MWAASDATIDWQHPYVIWGVALLAVLMLAGTWWLARRRGKINRGAIICGVISVLLHVILIALLPYASRHGGGPVQADADPDAGVVARIQMGTFSHETLVESASDTSQEPPAPSTVDAMPPLPTPAPVVPELASATETLPETLESETAEPAAEVPEPLPADVAASEALPNDPADEVSPESEPLESDDDWQPPADWVAEESSEQPVDEMLDAWINDLLVEAPGADANVPTEVDALADAPMANQVADAANSSAPPAAPPVTVPAETAGLRTPAPPDRVVGETLDEFANRRGAAKQRALLHNGGDQETEAAVEAGIQWLTRYQRADGAWDPSASGAGVERRVLGQTRGRAGTRATTGISGLALLAMLGGGHTHQVGTQRVSVRRGLQYLLTAQEPSGSLAGEATLYARTYSHGMASLAMCETAAMTNDPVARDSARRAVAFTLQAQHRGSGGWRYVPGDPGDMSQLGWQVMVLTSGRAAGVEVPEDTMRLVQRFLRSVRAGRTGGLASYKPGEQASRTMTAESLAVRLMLGERVPPAEIAEAQAFLLEEPPGSGEDNFYYWYYASLALHQLQDDAWREWNARMKSRLLALQEPDGSWPTSTTWGGYGGKVYTTAMACLCLEVYYRHLTEDERGQQVAGVHSELLPRR